MPPARTVLLTWFIARISLQIIWTLWSTAAVNPDRNKRATSPSRSEQIRKQLYFGSICAYRAEICFTVSLLEPQLHSDYGYTASSDRLQTDFFVLCLTITYHMLMLRRNKWKYKWGMWHGTMQSWPTQHSEASFILIIYKSESLPHRRHMFPLRWPTH
jgi:hypothetical protein